MHVSAQDMIERC